MNLTKLNKLILATALILGAINLVGSNILATDGQELAKLNHESILLTKDNQYLQNQISTHSSLATLEDWALNNGFVKINQVVTLYTTQPVALAR